MNFYQLMGMLVISVALAGCSVFTERGAGASIGLQPVLAELLDFELEAGFITFTVNSNGCTFFNSFAVQKAPNKENSIQVMRIRPDNCRMQRRPVSLQYSYKHLGINLAAEIQVIHRKSQPFRLSEL